MGLKSAGRFEVIRPKVFVVIAVWLSPTLLISAPLESITICVDIPSAKVKVLPVAVQFVWEKRFVVTPVCP